MSEHDESKLPRWARDRLDRLRRELATAKRDAAALRGEFEPPAEGGFTLEVHRGSSRHDEPPLLTLPAGPYRFQLHTPHQYRIDFGEREGVVEARLIEDAFSGVGALSVRPQSSNVIHLRGEPLFRRG